jgi:hypothetical protein
MVDFIALARVTVKQFWCGHDYTCDAEQGIPPTQEQLDDGVDGFMRYAKMYCNKCKYTPGRFN